MSPNINKYRKVVLGFACAIVASAVFSQADTEKWKLQLSFGINNPIDDGKNDGFYSKYINFPSVSFGIQHMFSNTLGTKLDFGFSRATSAEGSMEFKLNYSRINAQVVYDFTQVIGFLPEQMSANFHAGPGVSFTQPLGNYNENKYTYLNVIAGFELHYSFSRSLSIYGDVSYALSLTNNDKYDIAVDGFSFNGNLLSLSVGVSVSLSGCTYCN